MPPFRDLQSDYPLTFTWFRCLDMGAFKHRIRAIVSPADSVSCLLLIGGTVGLVSWFLTHAVPSYSSDVSESSVNPHRFPPASRTHLPAQFCSSERNPFVASFARAVGREQIVFSCDSPRNLWGRVERKSIDKEHIMFKAEDQ